MALKKSIKTLRGFAEYWTISSIKATSKKKIYKDEDDNIIKKREIMSVDVILLGYTTQQAYDDEFESIGEYRYTVEMDKDYQGNVFETIYEYVKTLDEFQECEDIK